MVHELDFVPKKTIEPLVAISGKDPQTEYWTYSALISLGALFVQR